MSYRNTDETAFHILMPKLDESAAQNEAERILLAELKESFRIYQQCQDKLQKLNNEISVANGDFKQCLRECAQRTAERLSFEDRIIVGLRNNSQLINLYEREKAKIIKNKQGNDLEAMLSQIMSNNRFRWN